MQTTTIDESRREKRDHISRPTGARRSRLFAERAVRLYDIDGREYLDLLSA